MDLKTLQEHIRTLATLEETESPVISYYASPHIVVQEDNIHE